MIQGYPGRASVAPGERLVLHVATNAPRFRASFYRWGDGYTLVKESPWLAGKKAPRGSAARDWNWPAYEFLVSPDWPSAVYMVDLQESGAESSRPSFDAAALFVVRGEGRSPLLYKIPLATYHAYNCTGGGCFYVDAARSRTPPGSKVSLRRPGGGIGSEKVYGAVDYYDPSSPRQTFAHWDAPFVRWLTRNGYAPEFCIDLDVHHEPHLLDRYRLLLNVGHDEYWSEPMRDRVETFIAHGGNVAFFGANVCWWRIHLMDDATAIVCHQGGPTGALDHWCAKTGVNRPEDSLTGVSYRHGGGWWDGPRRTRGYVVQQEHWVFSGTGLRPGDTFGADTSPPLVGYECDGAPFDHFDETTGRAVLSRDAHHGGTPSEFRALAIGVLNPDWQELPSRAGHPSGCGIHAATMGMYTRNGTVFTAGTTDWAQVLASGKETGVSTITRNVLDQLLRE